MFFKIRALKKFAKFTGKHLCQRLFFNTVAGLTLVQVFSCELYEIFKNNFITQHLRATASVFGDGKIALSEKCPNMEFFLVHIRTLFMQKKSCGQYLNGKYILRIEI